MRIFIEVNEEQYKKLKKLYKGTNNDVTFICGDKIEKIKNKNNNRK